LLSERSGLLLVEQSGIRREGGGRLGARDGGVHSVVLDVDLGLGGVGALVQGSGEGHGAEEHGSDDAGRLHSEGVVWGFAG
jgi:hypothetical protein